MARPHFSESFPMACIFSLSSLAEREDRESSYEAPRFGTWLARAKLLYGIWKTESGDEVLFDRQYRPRWRRTPDGIVTAADPGEWIDNIVQESWFYTDSASLLVRKRINADIAAEWRLQ
jgi:hypothetical protein